MSFRQIVEGNLIIDEGFFGNAIEKVKHLTGINTKRFAYNNGSAPKEVIGHAVKMLGNKNTTAQENHELVHGILNHPHATTEQKVAAIKHSVMPNDISHIDHLPHEAMHALAANPHTNSETLHHLVTGRVGNSAGYIGHGTAQHRVNQTNELHRLVANHPNVGKNTLTAISQHHFTRSQGGHTYSDDANLKAADHHVLSTVNHKLKSFDSAE